MSVKSDSTKKKYKLIHDSYVKNELESEGTNKVGHMLGVNIGGLEKGVTMKIAEKIAEKNKVLLRTKDFSKGHSTPPIYIHGFYYPLDELEGLKGEEFTKKFEEIKSILINSAEQFEKALNQVADKILSTLT